MVFNNPLDPDASKEELYLLHTVATSTGEEGDIEHDGEKIWKAGIDGSLSAIEPISGTIIRTLTVTPASGVAWFDRLLYVSSPQSNLLRSYDPLSGALIKTHSTGAYQLKLVTSMGNHLAAWDERSGHIVLFNPENGHIESLFNPGGVVPSGLTFYQGTLLLAEISSQSVYRFDLSGYIIGVYRSPLPGLRGICSEVDGQAIYLFTFNGTLARVSLP